MDLFKRKIVDPLKDLMTQGLSPQTLALSLAFGITGGLFPVPGTTSIICAFYVWAFKLNIVATQISNLLMTPIELFMMIPFIQFGDFIIGSQSFKGSASEIKDKFSEDFWGFISDFWLALIHGILAWAIFSLVATWVLYKALTPIIKKFQKKKYSLE
eukprot:TRINITY_DN3411_c0_g1_i2.p1 TRINITY_DN3411_c0_g1~~TRINITY_DN3411_c0_g1_i2.p1  ORF type:complete len:157 (+),score=24.33 TRINITY_DN3411_c0_g1_i2:111-581(+)